jgi:hypothetical protein
VNIPHMKSSPKETAVLVDNYLVDGVSYPRGVPIPRHLVAPHHLRELEVHPGTPPRKRSAGAAGSFVPGVSYQIGSDGQPICTAETADAEELAFKAQRELEEENWRASGLRYIDPETGEIREPEDRP